MQTAYYIGHNAGRVSMEYITYGMDGVVIRTGGGSSRAVMPDPRTPPPVPRRKYAGPPGRPSARLYGPPRIRVNKYTRAPRKAVSALVRPLYGHRRSFQVDRDQDNKAGNQEEQTPEDQRPYEAIDRDQDNDGRDYC